MLPVSKARTDSSHVLKWHQVLSLKEVFPPLQAARRPGCRTRLASSSSAPLDTRTASVPGNSWSTHPPSAGGGHPGGPGRGPRVGGGLSSCCASALFRPGPQNHTAKSMPWGRPRSDMVDGLLFLFVKKICWIFSPQSIQCRWLQKRTGGGRGEPDRRGCNCLT